MAFFCHSGGIYPASFTRCPCAFGLCRFLLNDKKRLRLNWVIKDWIILWTWFFLTRNDRTNYEFTIEAPLIGPYGKGIWWEFNGFEEKYGWSSLYYFVKGDLPQKRAAHWMACCYEKKLAKYLTGIWKKPLLCARISGFWMKGRFSHFLGARRFVWRLHIRNYIGCV